MATHRTKPPGIVAMAMMLAAGIGVLVVAGYREEPRSKGQPESESEPWVDRWTIPAPPREPLILPEVIPAQIDERTMSITLSEPAMTFRRVRGKAGDAELDLFVLDTEVTNAMYARFLRAMGHRKGDQESVEAQRQLRDWGKAVYGEHTVVTSTIDVVRHIHDPAQLWSDDQRPPANTEDHPVGYVTILEAEAFAQWLTRHYGQLGTFRLLTKDEWVLAAFGERAYPWGAEWVESHVHCGADSPEPVRARPDGRTPEGLYGMLGNMEELILIQGAEQGAGRSGDTGWMGGSYRDVHGGAGSVADFAPRRDYWGYWHNPEGKSQELGFRVMLDPADSEHRYYGGRQAERRRGPGAAPPDCDLATAVSFGDSRRLAQILGAGKSGGVPSQWSLVTAVIGGYVECARLLLEAGIEPDGALPYACTAGRLEMIHLLVSHGAALQPPTKPTDWEPIGSPLKCALEAEQMHVVRFLRDAGVEW